MVVVCPLLPPAFPLKTRPKNAMQLAVFIHLGSTVRGKVRVCVCVPLEHYRFGNVRMFYTS